MSMSNSLKRHIESRKKKMIIDKILNKKGVVALRNRQIRAVNYYAKIHEYYV